LEVPASADTYLFPVPLVGPDYQEIGLSRMVARLLSLPAAQAVRTESLSCQRAFVDQFAQAFHSAAFPLDYTDFQDKGHKRWIEELQI
jgi:hypothetical protein